MGHLEERKIAGTSVYYLDGRFVPRRAELELALRDGWVCGRIEYPARGRDRASFRVILEYPSRSGRIEQSVVRIGVKAEHRFRWLASAEDEGGGDR